jgi:membrane-bound ClpP family serine protease
MGLVTSVRDRFLSLILIFIGVVGLAGGILSGSMWAIIIAIIIILAGLYFQKTQHH